MFGGSENERFLGFVGVFVCSSLSPMSSSRALSINVATMMTGCVGQARPIQQSAWGAVKGLTSDDFCENLQENVVEPGRSCETVGVSGRTCCEVIRRMDGCRLVLRTKVGWGKLPHSHVAMACIGDRLSSTKA